MNRKTNFCGQVLCTYFYKVWPFCFKLVLLLFIESAEVDRQVEAALIEAERLQSVLEEREREVREHEELYRATVRQERARRLALRAEREAQAKSSKEKEDTKKDKA